MWRQQGSQEISGGNGREELEQGFAILHGLVSLALDTQAPGDSPKAARLLRDKGILALSREGNGLIKALLAMPDGTEKLFRPSEEDEIETFGSDYVLQNGIDFLRTWALRSTAEYQNELDYRKQNQLQIDAARWLIAQVNGDPDMDDAADAVGRTALLALSAKIQWPKGIGEFLKLLKKVASRKTIGVPADGPPQFLPLIQEWAVDCAKQILPILRETERFHELVNRKDDNPLVGLVSLPVIEMEDVAEQEAFTSKQWTKVTDRRTDETTLLSVLVLAALDAQPRPYLSGKQFKEALEACKAGWIEGGHKALSFISVEVPHRYQKGLDDLWNTFVDDATAYAAEGSESLTQWLKGEVRLAQPSASPGNKHKATSG